MYGIEGITPIQLIVIWKGKRVDDNQTVSELNIAVSINFFKLIIIIKIFWTTYLNWIKYFCETK